MWLYVQFAFVANCVIGERALTKRMVHNWRQQPMGERVLDLTPVMVRCADMLMTGLANLQYKMSIPVGARLMLIICNAVTIAHAACLVGVAVHVLSTPDITSDARDYAIVFACEVPVYAVLGFLNIRHLLSPGLRSRFHQWLLEHQVRGSGRCDGTAPQQHQRPVSPPSTLAQSPCSATWCSR